MRYIDGFQKIPKMLLLPKQQQKNVTYYFDGVMNEWNDAFIFDEMYLCVSVVVFFSLSLSKC